mmetsp:Transcript_2403/g.3642  ORF Transcript_2403/g.3642 Transcript_2403/m.3642 type:complete len:150 (+) Transcript_2403:314-763(+)
MWRNRVRTQREQYTLLKGGKTSSMTQGHIYTLEELGFVWLLPAQQDKKLEKAIQLAAKKKREESHVASDIISSAIAASNPEISDAATSAAVAAAAAVASANLAEVGQEITNFASVDLANALVEGVAVDEEEIFACVLRSVITNKMSGRL